MACQSRVAGSRGGGVGKENRTLAGERGDGNPDDRATRLRDPEDLTVAGILGEVSLPEGFAGFGVLADIDQVVGRIGTDDLLGILGLVALFVAVGAGLWGRAGRFFLHGSDPRPLVLILCAGTQD